MLQNPNIKQKSSRSSPWKWSTELFPHKLVVNDSDSDSNIRYLKSINWLIVWAPFWYCCQRSKWSCDFFVHWNYTRKHKSAVGKTQRYALLNILLDESLTHCCLFQDSPPPPGGMENMRVMQLWVMCCIPATGLQRNKRLKPNLWSEISCRLQTRKLSTETEWTKITRGEQTHPALL